MQILSRDAAEAFRGIDAAIAHQTFLMAGWALFNGDLRPYLGEITNCYTAEGKLLARATDSFRATAYVIPESTPYHLLVRGQPLAARVREITLRRNIDRLIRREIGAKELMRLLVDEVVHTSKWNRTVGNKVLAMSMPRAAVEFNHRVQRKMMFAAAPSDTMITFTYFEPGYAEFLQYGPTFTVNGYAVSDWESVHDGKDQDQELRVRFIRVPTNPRPGREGEILFGLRGSQEGGVFVSIGAEGTRLWKLVPGSEEPILLRTF